MTDIKTQIWLLKWHFACLVIGLLAYYFGYWQIMIDFILRGIK